MKYLNTFENTIDAPKVGDVYVSKFSQLKYKVIMSGYSNIVLQTIDGKHDFVISIERLNNEFNEFL